MIFVTVGNATQGFQRLLNAVEDCLTNGIFTGEEVFVQTGNNPGLNFRPCQYKAFLSMAEFQLLMEKSDLIIAHGGCGTIMQAIRLGKVPVVMPRLKKYNEHINDHQLQLVQALTAEGKIVPAFEPEDLPQAIAEARKRTSTPIHSSPLPMLALVKKAIDEILYIRGVKGEW